MSLADEFESQYQESINAGDGAAEKQAPEYSGGLIDQFQSAMGPAAPKTAISEYGQPVQGGLSDQFKSAIPEKPGFWEGNYEFLRPLAEASKAIGRQFAAPIRTAEEIAGQVIPEKYKNTELYKTGAFVGKGLERAFLSGAAAARDIQQKTNILKPNKEYQQRKAKMGTGTRYLEDLTEMVPQQAMNYAMGLLGGGFVGVLGSAGFQIYGSQYEQYRNDGLKPLQSAFLAAQDTAMQAPLEALSTLLVLGGPKVLAPLKKIPGAEKVFSSIAKGFIGKGAGWLARVAETIPGRIIGGGLEEGTEEFVQQLTQVITDIQKRMFEGKEINGKIIHGLVKKEIKSGAYQALVALPLGHAGAAIGIAAEKLRGETPPPKLPPKRIKNAKQAYDILNKEVPEEGQPTQEPSAENIIQSAKSALQAQAVEPQIPEGPASNVIPMPAPQPPPVSAAEVPLETSNPYNLNSTEDARRFSRHATEDQINNLRKLSQDSEQIVDLLRAQGRLQDAMYEATRGQFYREAIKAYENPKYGMRVIEGGKKRHIIHAVETPGEGGISRIKYTNENGNVVGNARLAGNTIGDIEVFPKYRRQGYGDLIISDLKKRGGKSGYATNEAAAKLFEKHGIKNNGIKPQLEAAPQMKAPAAGAQYPEIKNNEQLNAIAEDANKEPSTKQIQADNYKKARFNWQGLKAAIETPLGAIRRGVSKTGREWAIKLRSHYGKLIGIKGANGEDIDAFFGKNPSSKNVYIVDQVDPESGRFDEHKIMLGFNSAKAARIGYLANYESGWKGMGGLHHMTMAAFRNFVKSDRFNPKKPFSEQVPITREEWLNHPEFRPEKYLHREYIEGATGKMARATNNSIEKEYETWAQEMGYLKKKRPPARTLAKKISTRLDLHAALARQMPHIPVEKIKLIGPGERGGLQFNAIELASKIFDIPYLIFDVGESKALLNGAYFPDLRVIALNANSKKIAFSTFMHEATHLMEHDHPKLWGAMKDYILRSASDKGLQQWLDSYIQAVQTVSKFKTEEKYGKNYTADQYREIFNDNLPADEQIISEFVAYSVGKAVLRQSFWDELSAKNRGLFYKLSDLMRRLIIKIKELGKKAKYADIKFFEDLDVVSRNIASAFVRMASERVEKRNIPVGKFAPGSNVIQYELYAGDEKTPEFKKWIKDSVVKHPVYHATDASDFKIFRSGYRNVGIHVGTKEQAQERLNWRKSLSLDPSTYASGSRIIKAYINLKNPLRIEDPGMFDAESLIYELKTSKGNFTIKEIQSLENYAAEESYIVNEIDKENGKYDHHDLEELHGEFEKDLITLMHKYGYDGFVYKNESEISGLDKLSKEYSRLHQLNFIGKISDAELYERGDVLTKKMGALREKSDDSWAVLLPNQIKGFWNERPTQGPEYMADIEASESEIDFTIQSAAIYPEAEKKASKTDNIIAKDGASQYAMAQISSLVNQKEAASRGEKYYKKLYKKRNGYERSEDFWELPTWAGQIANTFKNIDFITIRNIKSAPEALNANAYQSLFFSAMDSNKAEIKKIAEKYHGKIYVGGYVDPSYFADNKNVVFVKSVKDAALRHGVKYSEGTDWRHFKKTPTIPRLECSSGCLHHCAFCTVPNKIVEKSKAVIDEQAESYRDLKFKLVYLNDKTFGQASNYKYLADVYRKIKNINPDFEGFIVQTTAPQLLKLDDNFLKKSGIKFVELGLETYNNDILKKINKPHNEALIDKAVEKLRRLKINFVPNIIVGLAGVDKGKAWSETKETYQHTLDFLERNKDTISHVNVYVLASYKGTKISEQLGVQKAEDSDENVIAKSWLKNRKIHDWFYDKILEFGSKQLDTIPYSSENKPARNNVNAMFDIEALPEEEIKEGAKGTASGNLLEFNIVELRKDAGGWKKIGSYLETISEWHGIPVTKNSIRYIGNLGKKLSEDRRLREDTIKIYDIRSKLANGEIDTNSKEYKSALKKYGAKLRLYNLRHLKRFNIGKSMVYGPREKSDVVKSIEKSHPIYGKFNVDVTQTKSGRFLIEGPILSEDQNERNSQIDAIVKSNKNHIQWYEDWNKFINSFSHIQQNKLQKYIKIMAILSSQRDPQTNMKVFKKVVDLLESGEEFEPGKISEGKSGINKDEFKKIMAIWNDEDPASNLYERQQVYGKKIGAYMTLGLMPHHSDAIVIDGHMPRLWGYDITWKANGAQGFKLPPEVERIIVSDIKSAAKRNNSTPGGVQAALWYASRLPDVVASTYREAAAYKPSEYLPRVMWKPLNPESLGLGKHFTNVELEKGEYLFAADTNGNIVYNEYSRNDIGNRISSSTEKNPYAPLVYFYESSAKAEKNISGKKNVYLVKFDAQKIYDAINDPLGYWKLAAERLKNDPHANLTNIFANLIRQTGAFDGFVIKSPEGRGNWVLVFESARIKEIPQNIISGMSDVVQSLEHDFPQTISDIKKIFEGRADSLYAKFNKLVSNFDEIKKLNFMPAIARFQGATGGMHEISAMINMRGPISAAKALAAEFGIQNLQNNVILIHTAEETERNGTYYRFKIKNTFKNLDDIYKKIESTGLGDFNISINPVAGSFFIDHFILDNDDKIFVDNFAKMLETVADKNFPGNINYRATSEIVGDPNFTGSPAKALKYYRKNLIDYYGKKEGDKRYAEAIKKAVEYKKEISKRLAKKGPNPLLDIDEGFGFPERNVTGGPITANDIGQFENPHTPKLDIEAQDSTDSYSDIWYSQMEQMIRNRSFPEKSTASNMNKVLDGMVKKGQIKKSELDWSGLQDMLKEEGNKRITKAQVLEYLNKNNLQISEVLYGVPADINNLSELSKRKLSDKIMRLASKSDYFNKLHPSDINNLGSELRDWTRSSKSIDDYPIINGFFNYEGIGINDLVKNIEFKKTKYSEWTLAGYRTEGYRELLITLPKNEYTEFESPHWEGIANPIAHTRFTEMDINGKRSLFIEEIQSDWAQAGRKYGFLNPKTKLPYGYHWERGSKKLGSALSGISKYSAVLYKVVDNETGKVVGSGTMKSEAKRLAGFVTEKIVPDSPFKTSNEWTLLILKRLVRYAAEHGYDNISWTTGEIQVERWASAFRKAVDEIFYNKKTHVLRARKRGSDYLEREVFKHDIGSNDALENYIGKQNAALLLSRPVKSEKELKEKESQWLRGEITMSQFVAYKRSFSPDAREGEAHISGRMFVEDSKAMTTYYDKIIPNVFKRFFSKKKWGSPGLSKEVVQEPYKEVYSITEKGRLLSFGSWVRGESGTKNEDIFINPSINDYYIKYEKGLFGVYHLMPETLKSISPGEQLTGLHKNIKFAVKSINNILGNQTLENTVYAWVADITNEMRQKALKEGFPVFDIEDEDIPEDTNVILKDKIGRKPEKLSDKIKTAVSDFAKNWETQMVDRLHPIKDKLGGEAAPYMLHRGLPGLESVFAAMMDHGKIKMKEDGLITTETKHAGFLPWLKSIGRDVEKFMYWQIARRSEVLAREGREKLLTDEDRQKIYDWVGESPKSRDSWQTISDEFAEWNKSVVDFAIDSHLLDPKNVALWTKDFYIPFYRIFEDEQSRMEFVRGPEKGRKYISTTVKRLRGSEARIGDPMENIIKNWSALIANSMANRARLEAFKYAVDHKLSSGLMRINKKGEEEEIPLIEEIPWGQTVTIRPMGKEKNLLFVHEKTGQPVLAFRDKGKSVFFKVNDPELYSALALVNKSYFDNIFMKLMGFSKRLLTLGATMTPSFRIANALRDTLHTFQISDNFIPFVDSARGFMKIWAGNDDYIEFMASGHAFGGSYVRADNPKSMQKYIKRISKKEGNSVVRFILDTPAKLWRFWEAIGEASENAARVQLYSNLKKKGYTKMSAAFKARDLMDFQMSGASDILQFFVQTIPFLNARIQGLYKMGRAAVENPRTFAAKGAMILAASLALWFLNKDDERYKELEDWEKWAYYHFWIGDTHIRIPKPFETGVIFSSSIEAAANVLKGNDEPKLLLDYLSYAFLNVFQFNPIPQIAKPLVEIYFNRSLFTGRPIEPERVRHLQPGRRFDPWDSETLRLIGSKLNISPKKMLTLLRGYTSWLGLSILICSDAMVRQIAEFPERPALDIGSYPGIGRFIKSGKNVHYTKYMSKFYDLSNQINELVATVNNYERIGDFEEARKIIEKNHRKFALKKDIVRVRKDLGILNVESRRIWSDMEMKADEKYRALQKIDKQRNELVKTVYDVYSENKE